MVFCHIYGHRGTNHPGAQYYNIAHNVFKFEIEKNGIESVSLYLKKSMEINYNPGIKIQGISERSLVWYINIG